MDERKLSLWFGQISLKSLQALQAYMKLCQCLEGQLTLKVIVQPTAELSQM